MDLPIVCFDMDGTLLDEQGRIHPEDLEMLMSAKPPALFIPSTGRPLDSTRRAFTRNGLYPGTPIPLHMVLQNGALLFQSGEVRLAYDELDAEIQRQLIELANDFREVTFLFFSAADIYVLWPNEFGLSLAASFDFVLRPLDEYEGTDPLSKVMCFCERPDALLSIARVVEGWPLDRCHSMPGIFEVANYGVNKGSGVARLLQQIGLAGCPVYAAGDWGNDLPLFQIAAASFAPATAPEVTKNAATYVIDVGKHGLFKPILQRII
ncbi:MAG: HAD-IIB family hydrolase [Anaerolineae bacterium]